MKIHCIEMQKSNFDQNNAEALSKMVGWIDYDPEDKTWDVTMADGSGFECKDQENATLLASIEEVKALLMRK